MKIVNDVKKLEVSLWVLGIWVGDLRGNSKKSFKNTTCPLLTLCKHIGMTKNEVPRTREAGQAQEMWFLMLLLTSVGAVPPGLCPLLCGQFYLSFRSPLSSQASVQDFSSGKRDARKGPGFRPGAKQKKAQRQKETTGQHWWSWEAERPSAWEVLKRTGKEMSGPSSTAGSSVDPRRSLCKAWGVGCEPRSPPPPKQSLFPDTHSTKPSGVY